MARENRERNSLRKTLGTNDRASRIVMATYGVPSLEGLCVAGGTVGTGVGLGVGDAAGLVYTKSARKYSWLPDDA